MLSNLRADLRFALRSLWRRPGFSAFIVLTLGLGIGANTAMFAVVHAALIKPLPYQDPERLVFGRCTFEGRINPWASAPDYYDYRDQADTLESLAALTGFTDKVTVTGGQRPERAAVLLVTQNFFPVLGVKPFAGRWFSAEEGEPGGADVIVLDGGFAARWAGGAREAIGRTLAVNGRSATVVGVMPATFRFLYDVDMWVPARRGEGAAGAARRFHNWLMVGRLKRGVPLEVARHQVDAISKRLEEQYPDSNRNKALRLDTLQAGLTGEERPSLLLLMGAVAMVLLIACANVAGILLARGRGRRSELTVRASLGATRWQLVRQLLIESLVLAFAAGVMGIVLGAWLRTLLPVAIGLDRDGASSTGIGWPVLWFALTVTLATGVLFGIVPALRGASANLAGGLAPGTRTTDGKGGARLRSILA
ncbi:MAG: FtsX-like permease family protein, partial [Acidobacteria bacterium]